MTPIKQDLLLALEYLVESAIFNKPGANVKSQTFISLLPYSRKILQRLKLTISQFSKIPEIFTSQNVIP